LPNGTNIYGTEVGSVPHNTRKHTLQYPSQRSVINLPIPDGRKAEFT